MNIFKILSSADGTINEPNISAFLAYILNPKEDHSLGCEFLSEILAADDGFNLIEDSKNNFRSKIENDNYRVEIKSEQTVFPNENDEKHHRDIDVLIQISEKNSGRVKYAICLENKILTQSASDENQLREEMKGLANLYKENSPDVKLGLIYLVPEKIDKINGFFDAVDSANKKMLLWKSDDNSTPTIKKSLAKILMDESIGAIDPIYDSMKHLIKSFIAFINYDFKCASEVNEIQTEKNDYGKPIREYLKDIWKELDFEKEYNVDDIRDELKSLVKKESGKELNKTTGLCQVYRATVNNLVRVNYYVKTPNDEGNLFYKSGDKLRKFDLSRANKDIEIYYKQNGEVKKITVGELRANPSDEI